MTVLPRRVLGRHRASARASPPGSRTAASCCLPTAVGALLHGRLRARPRLRGLRMRRRSTPPVGARRVLRPVRRHAHRHRPRRARDRRRPVHRARPSPPCRPGPARTGAPASSPPSTCSSPPSWWPARSSSPALQKAGVDAADLVRRARRRSTSLAGLIVFRTLPTSAVPRFPLDPLPGLLPPRGEGLENLAKAGPNAIIALNHVSFLDAALALSLLDQEPVFAIDHGDRPALVGEAVPEAHPRHAARSDQADGDAHADQRRQGRRDAGHLSRGAPHRHRQPDEGL